jgi:phospholipase D1/2
MGRFISSTKLSLISSTMAGKPFKVGRFAHTLRVRLMREHMGVDVDAIEEDQLMSRPPVADADDIETWDPDHEQDRGDEEFQAGVTKIKRRTAGERFGRTIHSGLMQGEPSYCIKGEEL